MNVEAVCDGCKGVGKVLRFSGIEVSGASCVSCHGTGTILVTLTPAGVDAVIRQRVADQSPWGVFEVLNPGLDQNDYCTFGRDAILAALGVTERGTDGA